MKKMIRHALFTAALLAAFLIGAALFGRTALADEYDVTYKLTTLDGQTITESTYGDRVQLLAFYKADVDSSGNAVYWNSENFLSSLQEELEYEWVKQNDVVLILVPYTNVTDEQVQSFISRFGADIESDNVVFTKADTSAIYSMCANDTIHDVCCMPVQNGRRLGYQDNVSDLKETREMMDEIEGVDLEAMYQVVQVKADYDYTAAFEVLELVNEERTNRGLSALKMDKELLACAMQRAAELSIMNSHTRPSGEHCLDISDLAWGENIAVNQDSPEMVMGWDVGWMGSDGHRENILNTRWSSIGIGAVTVTTEGQKQCFWCQLFGEDLEEEALPSGYTNSTKYPKIKVLDHYLYGTIPQAYNLETSYTESDDYTVYSHIPVGETAKVSLTYFYFLGSCTDILTDIYPGCLTYSSSDPSIAAISSKGVVTAKKEGEVTITLRSKYSSPKAEYLFSFKLTVVKALPVITAQPEDQKVNLGKTAAFTVKATGDDLKYQWYYRNPHDFGWTAVSAAYGQKATYKVTATEARNGYQYYCVITNGSHPVRTEAVTLHVKPAVSTQPEDQKVSINSTAHFSVKAKGPGNLSYQWYYRTSSSGDWKKVSSSDGTWSDYYVTATAKRDGYQYRCKISNSNGYVYSKTVTLRVKPRITSQSWSPTVTKGRTATFSVTAEGKDLTYQWYYRTSSKGKWTAVTSAAGKKATYKFTAKARHNGYQYRCKVKNSAGYVYSDVKTLTVK
ncbi:MAG: Ig-like domain-containing protein [Lachnospiraceae bacterium]|nr:Ig-like domain-containing protein [Lachnospiraceae bacterium]